MPAPTDYETAERNRDLTAQPVVETRSRFGHARTIVRPAPVKPVTCDTWRKVYDPRHADGDAR
ncbi:MAG: hypothetical protein V4530_06200 [Pseudomonadota bacterium]